MSSDSMNQEIMQSRAERVIDSLTNAFLSAAEAAAERLELSTKFAQLRARMTVFSSILETINARKEAIYKRIDACQSQPIIALLKHEIEILDCQEISILETAGMSGDLKAIVHKSDERLYRREGSRFVEV